MGQSRRHSHPCRVSDHTGHQSDLMAQCAKRSASGLIWGHRDATCCVLSDVGWVQCPAWCWCPRQPHTCTLTGCAPKQRCLASARFATPAGCAAVWMHAPGCFPPIGSLCGDTECSGGVGTGVACANLALTLFLPLHLTLPATAAAAATVAGTACMSGCLPLLLFRLFLL